VGFEAAAVDLEAVAPGLEEPAERLGPPPRRVDAVSFGMGPLRTREGQPRLAAPHPRCEGRRRHVGVRRHGIGLHGVEQHLRCVVARDLEVEAERLHQGRVERLLEARRRPGVVPGVGGDDHHVGVEAREGEVGGAARRRGEVRPVEGPGRPGVHRRQGGVDGDELLEVGHHPPLVAGAAVEAVAELVEEATAPHAVEGSQQVRAHRRVLGLVEGAPQQRRVGVLGQLLEATEARVDAVLHRRPVARGTDRRRGPRPQPRRLGLHGVVALGPQRRQRSEQRAQRWVRSPASGRGPAGARGLGACLRARGCSTPGRACRAG
jgi:hypothetical protein